MTNHWIDRLSEYHDDELTPEERAACEAHLAECTTCRDALADV
jgi:anti-sigma factor RsiW